jgi:hypothetical protein
MALPRDVGGGRKPGKAGQATTAPGLLIEWFWIGLEGGGRAGPVPNDNFLSHRRQRQLPVTPSEPPPLARARLSPCANRFNSSRRASLPPLAAHTALWAGVANASTDEWGGHPCAAGSASSLTRRRPARRRRHPLLSRRPRSSVPPADRAGGGAQGAPLPRRMLPALSFVTYRARLFKSDQGTRAGAGRGIRGTRNHWRRMGSGSGARTKPAGRTCLCGSRP